MVAAAIKITPRDLDLWHGFWNGFALKSFEQQEIVPG